MNTQLIQGVTVTPSDNTPGANQAGATPSGTALSLTPSARSSLNTVSIRGLEPGASVL